MNSKYIVLGLLVLMSSGCKFGMGEDEFDWAVVDRSRVRQAMIDNVSKQHGSAREAFDKKSKLSDQVGALKDQLRDEKERFLVNADDIRKAKEQGTIYIRVGSTRAYFRQCLEEDPKIVEITQQLNGANRELLKIEYIERQLRSPPDEMVDEIIQDVTRGKYQLVIDSNTNNLIYNRSGILLDVTEVVIKEVRDNRQDLTWIE